MNQGQTAHQQIEGDGGQGPHGTWRLGGGAGTKAHRQEVERIFKVQPRPGLYLEQTSCEVVPALEVQPPLGFVRPAGSRCQPPRQGCGRCG